MKFFKAIVLILFFFISMIFFVQNTETLTQEIIIKIDIFQWWNISSPPSPIYLLILLSFALGASFTTLFFLTERIRLSSIAKKQQKNSSQIQKLLAKTKTELEATKMELNQLKQIKEEISQPSFSSTNDSYPFSTQNNDEEQNI